MLSTNFNENLFTRSLSSGMNSSLITMLTNWVKAYCVTELAWNTSANTVW